MQQQQQQQQQQSYGGQQQQQSSIGAGNGMTGMGWFLVHLNFKVCVKRSGRGGG